jgi:hypothetical protein
VAGEEERVQERFEASARGRGGVHEAILKEPRYIAQLQVDDAVGMRVLRV